MRSLCRARSFLMQWVSHDLSAGAARRRDRRLRRRARQLGRAGARRGSRLADAGADGHRADEDRRRGKVQPAGAGARHLPADRAGGSLRRVASRADGGGRGSAAARDRHPSGRPSRRSHGHGVARDRRGHPPGRPAGQRHRRERDRRPRQDRRRAGARRGGRRPSSADEPDDGGHLRARADRQQGQHLRRRRALFERRAARRREHLPRSHRAGMARDDRGPSRSVERAVRKRCAGRERAVSLARTRARGRGWTAVARVCWASTPAPRITPAEATRSWPTWAKPWA